MHLFCIRDASHTSWLIMLTPSHEEHLEQYVDGCFVRDCTDAHVRMRHTRLRTHPPTCTLAHSLYMTSTNSQGHSDSVRLLLAQSLMPFMRFVLHKKHTYVRHGRCHGLPLCSGPRLSIRACTHGKGSWLQTPSGPRRSHVWPRRSWRRHHVELDCSGSGISNLSGGATIGRDSMGGVVS